MVSGGACGPVRSLINIVPDVRAFVVRLLVVVLVGVPSGQALTECAGWSASAADRPACSERHREPASGANMTNCCTMSERSDPSAPPESLAARPPLRLLGADFSPVAAWVSPLRPSALAVSPPLRHVTPVPLYLQQVSLLI
jgi:hypothetical protein